MLAAKTCNSVVCEGRMEVPESSDGRNGEIPTSLTTSSGDKIEMGPLLLRLASKKTKVYRSAAADVRRLVKDPNNRVCIGESGAIPILVSLLSTLDLKTQEHAIAALQTLPSFESTKRQIVEAGAIHPIVKILKRGTVEVRENSAATSFNLSYEDEHLKLTVGNSGAIPPLVLLLQDGSTGGKREASSALLTLSMCEANQAKILRAGVIPPLIDLLEGSSGTMAEVVSTILAFYSTRKDGHLEICRASVTRNGSPRQKKNSALILRMLCKDDDMHTTTARNLGAAEALADLSCSGETKTSLSSTNSDEKIQMGPLLLKLASNQMDVQRSATREVRRLAKNPNNRLCIAESGAIPILVSLLSTPDLKTQEDAIAALLSLSILESNKTRIVGAGAIHAIVELLTQGTVEGRQSAAGTLFSLSCADEEIKLTIGNSGAIPPLARLLQYGTMSGKKDALSALLSLFVCQANKAKIVKVGVIPPLIHLLQNSSPEMADDVSAMLAFVATHEDGCLEIGRENMVPILVELIRNGSSLQKENCASILLILCKGDIVHATTARNLGAAEALAEWSCSGTGRGRREASEVIALLNEKVPSSTSRPVQGRFAIARLEFRLKASLSLACIVGKSIGQPTL